MDGPSKRALLAFTLNVCVCVCMFARAHAHYYYYYRAAHKYSPRLASRYIILYEPQIYML